MKQYFTPEKILDTLQLCEENGVNTAVLRCDQHVIQLLQRYRRERGGQIQWIAQTYPTEQSPLDNVKLALDHGAVGALVQGITADRLVAVQRMDVLESVVTFLHQNRLSAGVGVTRWRRLERFHVRICRWTSFSRRSMTRTTIAKCPRRSPIS